MGKCGLKLSSVLSQEVLEKRAESAASFNAWKENKKEALRKKAKEETKKKEKEKEEAEEKMMKAITSKKVRQCKTIFCSWAQDDSGFR